MMFRVDQDEIEIVNLGYEDYRQEVAMGATVGIGMKRPAHPGGFDKHGIIDPLGSSVTRAAAVLSVTRATLSTLLNERAHLTPRWRCGSRRRSACRWTP